MLFDVILNVYYWIIDEAKPHRGKRSLRSQLWYISALIVWLHILPVLMALLVIGTFAYPPYKVFDFWNEFEEVKKKWYRAK